MRQGPESHVIPWVEDETHVYFRMEKELEEGGAEVSKLKGVDKGRDGGG